MPFISIRLDHDDSAFPSFLLKFFFLINTKNVLTTIPREESVISRPHANHLTLAVTGETRAQNDTTEPSMATAGTGFLINAGITSRISLVFSIILISVDVMQHP